MNISFDLQYPKQFPWLRPIIEKEFAATLRRAAEGQLAAFGRQYALDDAIASGDTFKSFEISDVENHGDRMEITLMPKGDREQIVSWIEFGRPANASGFPSTAMAANILKWAEDKKILPAGADERTINTIVWSIASVIAREGIEPRFIMEKAERRYRPQIVRMFEAASRRIARQINAKINLEHN